MVTRVVRVSRVTRMTKVIGVNRITIISFHIIIFGMSESSGFQKYSIYIGCFRYFVFVIVFVFVFVFSLMIFE